LDLIGLALLQLFDRQTFGLGGDGLGFRPTFRAFYLVANLILRDLLRGGNGFPRDLESLHADGHFGNGSFLGNDLEGNGLRAAVFSDALYDRGRLADRLVVFVGNGVILAFDENLAVVRYGNGRSFRSSRKGGVGNRDLNGFRVGNGGLV
jgi:hypothetical protein